jgi:hypothetical protein
VREARLAVTTRERDARRCVADVQRVPPAHSGIAGSVDRRLERQPSPVDLAPCLRERSPSMRPASSPTSSERCTLADFVILAGGAEAAAARALKVDLLGVRRGRAIVRGSHILLSAAAMERA